MADALGADGAYVARHRGLHEADSFHVQQALSAQFGGRDDNVRTRRGSNLAQTSTLADVGTGGAQRRG